MTSVLLVLSGAFVLAVGFMAGYSLARRLVRPVKATMTTCAARAILTPAKPKSVPEEPPFEEAIAQDTLRPAKRPVERPKARMMVSR